MNESGLISQAGSLNTASLTITGDRNLYSVVQDGSENSITGTMTANYDGQVAVAQVGNNNTANFSQSGSFNNIGISQ
jgi:hypothetical protein